MKFKKGELVYSRKTGNVLYEVIGYTTAGSIILLPEGLDNKLINRVIFFKDDSLYIKRD